MFKTSTGWEGLRNLQGLVRSFSVQESEMQYAYGIIQVSPLPGPNPDCHHVIAILVGSNCALPAR